MLTTAVQCTEIVTHIYSLLANQVSRFILQELGILDRLDNHIYVNSMLHNPSKSYDQHLNPILVEDKFTCTFDIKHSSLGLIWDNNTVSMHMDAVRHRRDVNTRIPILLDKYHRISLYDSVLPFNIGMNCTISLRDYSFVHEVIDRFHLRFNRGELLAVPNLSYDFPLPKEILMTLWALASTCGISKQCFPQWLKLYSNGAIQRIETTGLANKKVEWVIKREVFESLVKIEYDFGEPEKEGLQQSETLGINFTATLHSSRPSVLYVDYPIIVNNTMVPESVIKVDTSYQRELYKVLEHPNMAMDPVYQSTKFLMWEPVRNPWYDNWQVPKYNTIHSGLKSKPFFIGAFTLDVPSCSECPCTDEHKDDCMRCKTPYDPSGCSNCPYHKCSPYEEECTCYCQTEATTDIDVVADLDMYRLTDKVINYFAEHKEECLRVENIYNISVYVDDIQMDPSLLEFDGRILKVSNKLGPNHIYRLVMSFTPPRHVDYAMKDIQGDDPFHPLPKQVYKHPFLLMLDCIIVPKHEGAKN